MKKSEIIQHALHKLSHLSGLNFRYNLVQENFEKYDAIVKLFQKNEPEHEFKTEIKNELRAVHLPQLIELHKNIEDHLLVTQYLSRQHREQLRTLQVNYLDSSGNCFIKQQKLFLFIDNQKVSSQRIKTSGKLFTYAGLKLIYALLLNPKLLNESYRKIAFEADIALGTIGKLLTELQENEFIKVKDSERTLINTDQLFAKWAEAYADKLLPSIFRGRYKFIGSHEPDYWKTLKLKNAYWGGEPAANILDKYLQPQEFVIYSNEEEHALMKQLKIVPDNNGNLKLLKLPISKKSYELTVDPYLVYAELIHSKDSRCLEAAQRIKEQYIDFKS